MSIWSNLWRRSQKPSSANERRKRYRRGRFSEVAAGVMLMAKGYRILARRFKTPIGEVDLIAVRGRRLAFVEVKARRSLELAQASVSDQQRARVRRASELWLARHERYQQHDLAFDVVFVIGYGWPRHIPYGL